MTKTSQSPEKSMARYRVFPYCRAKLFNSLPIRETQDINTFETLTKDWIWKEIPSYLTNSDYLFIFRLFIYIVWSPLFYFFDKIKLILGTSGLNKKTELTLVISRCLPGLNKETELSLVTAHCLPGALIENTL